MSRRGATFFALALAAALTTPVPASADGQLAPDRFDALDRAGYITPSFKSAVHELVDTRQELASATAEDKQLAAALPALQQRTAAEGAKAVALRQELAKYEHPDEIDFAALQDCVNDPASTADQQRILAQAYVWTYTTSSHEAEAQQYLQAAEKKIADRQKADADANAARVAARARLIARAQAHDLTLEEWREFLDGMSQEDLVKYVGPPSSKDGDYWTYNGAWVSDATLRQKVGLIINFEGGHVLTVAEPPPPH